MHRWNNTTSFSYFIFFPEYFTAGLHRLKSESDVYNAGKNSEFNRVIVFTHSWPPPGSRRRWCRWAGLWLASRSRRWACRCPAGRPGSPSTSGPGTETGGVAPSASCCSEQTRPAQEACRGRTHTHYARKSISVSIVVFFSTCVKSFNSLDPNCPSFTSMRAVIVSPCCKMCTIFGEAVFNRDRENKQLPSDGNEVSALSSVGSVGKTKFCSQCWQHEAIRGDFNYLFNC